MWSNAPQIEHFVDWRQLRLESLETVGRLAYDDGTLYVAMECFAQPKKGSGLICLQGPKDAPHK